MADVVLAEGYRPPPTVQGTWFAWLRDNLFSTWINTLLTFGALYIIYFAVSGVWAWGITNAVWEAENRRVCFDINPDGACWAGVIAWFGHV